MRGSIAVVVLTLAAGVPGEQTPKAGPVREFSSAQVVDESAGATANVSLGDVDGDGDLDMVLAKGRHWQSVDRVLINDGRGTFTARDLGTAQDSSYSALLADVDGDGDLDVVVSNDSAPGRVYLNDGKANFRDASAWGDAKWPTRFAAIADLNRDGRPDVVAANRSPREGLRSRVCLNDGRGQMLGCTELAVGPASGIAAADFDRDGHIDLAVPFRDGGQSVVLYNDGKAGFGRTVPFGPETAAASAVAAGDLDGNGWPDLVVGDENISVFVHLNDARGSLGTGRQLTFDGLPAPRSIAIGDLNRDGFADIVIGYYTERGSVLFNDGTGRAFRHVRFGDAQAAVYGLALGDLDGDGYLDIATARNNAPSVVYFNRAGSGLDVVLASDRPSPPSPRLQPFNADAGKLGVWRGQLSYLSYRRALEVSLDSLTPGPGTIAGYTNQTTNGIPYCRSSLTLVERRPDGSYLFTENGLIGCVGPMGSVEARWLDDGRAQWEVMLGGSPVRAKGTLERATPPIPLLEATAADPASPAVGTWRGEVREGTSTYGVETRLERLITGQPAGRQLFFSPSPSGRGDSAWCPGPLVLKEQRADGSFVFTKATEKGTCGDDEFRARLVEPGRLVLEWFWSRGATPDASATLERKR